MSLRSSISIVLNLGRCSPFSPTYRSIASCLDSNPCRSVYRLTYQRERKIMKLLHVDSSILGANSVSRLLSAEVVAEWRKAIPKATVAYLDLAVASPNHFTIDA